MKYEVVIGLEVHVELSTKTKIFCGCSTEFGGEPNSHTCPVCLGMPGTLPVLNKGVVDRAIKAGLALNCTIQENNQFDRKNYFYPDLPKDYQISQLYLPICRNGSVKIRTENGEKSISILEIHMEEDAGKLVHDQKNSFVDYNRCGVPLIEIVSNPDLRNAAEVIAYLEKIQETLIYMDVSDCKMQEGSMRCDVNLSVRPEGSQELGTRTETKNMNSFKAIQRAIEYETRRQISSIEKGESIFQETRRWDDEKGETFSMRSKENAQDYRYFPDPDLVPIVIDENWSEGIKRELPELAEEKRFRYSKDFGIDENMGRILTASKNVAIIFEDISSRSDLPKEAAKVVSGEILRLAKEEGKSLDDIEVDGKGIARVIRLIEEGKINRNIGKTVIEEVYKNNVDPEKYVKEKNLLIIEDVELLEEITLKVLLENPKSIIDYREGKEKAFGFLIGQIMRLLKGQASPQAVNKMLKEKLESEGVEVKLSDKAIDVQGNKETEKKPSINSTEEKEKASLDKGNRSLTKLEEIKKLWSEEGGAQGKNTEINLSNRYRTKTCNEITREDIEKTATLAGWVYSIRNHGGVAFIDLRDHYGITQVVVSDELLKGLHREMVISVSGRVLLRDETTVNKAIHTGEVELKAEKIEILGNSHSQLPFEVDSSTETREDIRLKYRFLDLRNPKVHDNIILRAEIIKYLRKEMEAMDFLEIQTPILANSSPEGARDYLVPSRKHKGKFYALPQAPQQFKQLLMVSGFDKYFQIAPCFRDEDARLDRSPGEFYQLDFEMAFATQEDVFAVAEQVLSSTFKRFSKKPVSETPYIRIPFAEAMLKYGTDKPDLRNPLVIQDLTKFFEKVDFKPFQGKMVRGIVVPDGGRQPKSFFSSMEKYAISIGMKGLGYISVKEDLTYKGPIDKFFTEGQKIEIRDLMDLKVNDVLYFISDEFELAPKFAGQIRTEVGKRLDLIKNDRFEFCFITDFPMYEINEETGKIDFTHNPFSMPQGEMAALVEKNPLDIKAYQYDIVCNGVELSSGAVRNHKPEIMVKAFEIAGYSEETVNEKFGALFNAFQYGAPPHAGMAPGVDRIVMLLMEEENIREVIAFPLNSNAQNLMLDAPSDVSEQQLRDVHVKIR